MRKKFSLFLHIFSVWGSLPRIMLPFRVLKKTFFFLSYFSLVFILFLSAWGIAMGVSDLGVVLSIVGGTSANLAGFILPCWYYITLYPEMHFMKICAIVVFTISFILMPVVVICVILDLTGSLWVQTAVLFWL